MEPMSRNQSPDTYSVSQGHSDRGGQSRRNKSDEQRNHAPA